jgi:hypothetical protein
VPEHAVFEGILVAVLISARGDGMTQNPHHDWGKADPQIGAEAFHPLAFHSLDVAAVAHETLRLRIELLAGLAGAEPIQRHRTAAHQLDCLRPRLGKIFRKLSVFARRFGVRFSARRWAAVLCH